MTSATLRRMEIDLDEGKGDDVGPDGWEHSVADYVWIEEHSDLVKHEFDNGQIRAMSGGTIKHARLAMAFVMQLAPQLANKPCMVASSDSRVRIKSAGLITYPDLSIMCASEVMDDEDALAQTNPLVVIEVTSKSSEKYDRGKKRIAYQQLESLREYVIVSQREKAIDVYTRAVDGTWPEPVRSGPGERARLHSIGCEIDIDKLYTDPRQRPAAGSDEPS
jgi:Uma2 family endonuclease